MEKMKVPWEEVDETGLTAAQTCVYRIRRRALGLYLEGSSAKEIFRATGLSHRAVMRLWERCRAKNPKTGECFGFQALVPKSKMKTFIR